MSLSFDLVMHKMRTMVLTTKNCRRDSISTDLTAKKMSRESQSFPPLTIPEVSHHEIESITKERFSNIRTRFHGLV